MNEVKHHVSTLPVKLVRPQNDLRKKHPDRMFGSETSHACDSIASFIGPQACIYLSQDDKSSVFIGKTAAKVQSCLLMSMRVRVRSSKHNNSIAYSHQEDLAKFRELHPEVFEIPESGGTVKPVLFKGVDRGPDENPRFDNNKKMACKTFHEMNLDCLIEMTQAPGHSAFNRAERMMFHLSKEMAGLVLPADTFGSHLHNGETIDEELDIQNVEAAGKVLCDIWRNLVVDGYDVDTEYVSHGVQEDTKQFDVSPLYRSRHLIETQYMTCVLKCDDPECCSPMRTQVDVFFPGRRVPTLIPIR